MAVKALQLLVIVLLCTHVFSSIAIPMSRTRKLVYDDSQLVSTNSNTMKQEKPVPEEKDEVTAAAAGESMMKDIHVMDYPSTGPNPYHTPKPPYRA